MTSRNRMRETRTKRPIITPDRALPSTGSSGRRPTIYDVGLQEVGPRLAAATDRWGPCLAIVALVAFAAVFAGHVLLPALGTLTDASVITWTGEGP